MRANARFIPLLALLICVVALPLTVRAAPIAPTLSITINPDKLVPAQAGYVYVGGAYPLNVLITMDDQPLDVFWTGEGYMAIYAFDFDEPAADHPMQITVENPLTGQHIDRAASISVEAFTYPSEFVALPFKLVPLLDRDLNERELARLAEIYAPITNQGTFDWPFSAPVASGVITSRFGGDRTYNNGLWRAHHTGIDFRRSIGEPIVAAAAGRVAASELLNVRGNVIIIDHGHGVFTQYAHLSQPYVGLGDHVERGQLIGAAGATGRANGPHLHFEVIVRGITVDPLRWFGLVPNFVPPREVSPEDGPSGQ